MKKRMFLCVSASLALGLAGCTPGDLINQYIGNTGETTAETPAAENPRIYMDEVAGKLVDFTGSQLTLKDTTEEITYTFDVSQATLECADGMITGDKVSVIYEGQLTDTDTSAVKVLKVADDYHEKTELPDRTAHGSVVSLTPNTLTIRSQKGTSVTYPITGVRQYYQNGIAAGKQVILHFKGNFSKDTDTAGILGAEHIKVVSISDIDPLSVPEPTPTPEAQETQTDENSIVKQFRASIQNVSSNILQVVPNGFEQTVLNLDMTGIPCDFSGGFAVGSGVTVYYTGTDFAGDNLDGITVTAITGDNPDTMDVYHINFTVSGTITGTTANTVTLQTGDGAQITCFTDSAQNSSTGSLAVGSSVCVTFNPVESRNSNILTSIKITDA